MRRIRLISNVDLDTARAVRDLAAENGQSQSRYVRQLVARDPAVRARVLELRRARAARAPKETTDR